MSTFKGMPIVQKVLSETELYTSEYPACSLEYWHIIKSDGAELERKEANASKYLELSDPQDAAFFIDGCISEDEEGISFLCKNVCGDPNDVVTMAKQVYGCDTVKPEECGWVIIMGILMTKSINADDVISGINLD